MVDVSLSLLGGAGWQFLDNSGRILSGGRLYTYEAGTTTPAQTWAEHTGTTSNGVYVQLDQSGRPEGEIWLSDTDSYKFVLVSATGQTLGTYDYISGGATAQDLLDFEARLASGAQGNGAELVGVLASSDYSEDTVGWSINVLTNDYSNLPYDYFKYRGATTDDQAFADMVIAQSGTRGLGVTFPPGTITLGEEHTFAGSGLTMHAAVTKRTRIVCETTARIIYSPGLLDEHFAPVLNVEGVVFSTTGGIHPTGPLRAEFGVNALGSTSQPLIVEHCEFSGLTESDGFLRAFEAHNVPNGLLSDIRFYGDRNNFVDPVASGAGLYITADVGNATGGWKLDQINAYWMNEAVHMEGHVEGVICTSWNIVGVRSGLTILDDGASINVLLQMSDCFINCPLYCVYVRNMSDVRIDKTNEFFGEVIPNDAAIPVWNGVLFEVSSPFVPINAIFDIEGQAAGNTSPAAVRVGTSIIGASGSGTPGTVHGYYIGNTTAIQLSADTLGTLVDGAKFLTTTNVTNINNAGGASNTIGTNFVMNGI